MLGSCFPCTVSAGPLETASFLRLIVLRDQQFKTLECRRNTFNFPSEKTKSPIQLWSRNPNWLEYSRSVSLKLENGTQTQTATLEVWGSAAIYSLRVSVSICRTKGTRLQQNREPRPSALRSRLLITLLASYSRAPVFSQACRLPGHHPSSPQLLPSITTVKICYRTQSGSNTSY